MSLDNSRNASWWESWRTDNNGSDLAGQTLGTCNLSDSVATFTWFKFGEPDDES